MASPNPLSPRASAEGKPEAHAFIQRVVGQDFGENWTESLGDGIILCTLANKLKDGCCPKPSASKMPFKKMENIGNFIAAAKKLGVPDHYNFATVDLYEDKNIAAVVTCVLTLKRQLGFGFERTTSTNKADWAPDVS